MGVLFLEGDQVVGIIETLGYDAASFYGDGLFRDAVALPAHPADQLTNIGMDSGPSPASPRLPTPIRPEATSGPAEHGLRLNNDDGA